MSTKVQIRRGSTSSANAFTGAEGELYVDLGEKSLRVHDGSTPGGFRLPNYDTVTEYVDGAVSNLVNAAPSTLDTLNELASALGNDANFATNITNIIAEKAKSSDLATVATSGNYYDLTNSPFIPNLTSDLMNDAGFVGNSGGTISGLLTTQETTEVINAKTSAINIVVHDFLTGSIWYHSNISGNFTPNFTNVPTTDDRSTVVTLILNQGSTTYLPTSFQINGNAQTIKWLGGTIPVSEPNRTDIISFVMIRTNNSWIVLGSLSSYG